jgi:hypothetical protein
MEHASALLGITAILANAVSNAKMIVPEMVSATTVNANVTSHGMVMIVPFQYVVKVKSQIHPIQTPH